MSERPLTRLEKPFWPDVKDLKQRWDTVVDLLYPLGYCSFFRKSPWDFIRRFEEDNRFPRFLLQIRSGKNGGFKTALYLNLRPKHTITSSASTIEELEKIRDALQQQPTRTRVHAIICSQLVKAIDEELLFGAAYRVGKASRRETFQGLSKRPKNKKTRQERFDPNDPIVYNDPA